MRFAVVLVAVAPQHQLLEDEEQRDATEQRHAHAAVVRPGPASSMASGSRPSNAARQQRAGGESHHAAATRASAPAPAPAGTGWPAARLPRRPAGVKPTIQRQCIHALPPDEGRDSTGAGQAPMLHIAAMREEARLLGVGAAVAAADVGDMPSAARRCAAPAAYRSHCQRPSRAAREGHGVAADPRRGKPGARRRRTSKCRALMAGPRSSYAAATPGADVARARPRRCCRATPAARPRQPACATATAEPSLAANSTGRQSAVSTAHTVPACAMVTAASRLRLAARAGVQIRHFDAMHLAQPAWLARQAARRRAGGGGFPARPRAHHPHAWPGSAHPWVRR